MLRKVEEHNMDFATIYSRLICGGYKPDPELTRSPFNYILKEIGCELPVELMVLDKPVTNDAVVSNGNLCIVVLSVVVSFGVYKLMGY